MLPTTARRPMKKTSAPNFTAVRFGLTSVEVDWLSPSNIGGSPILSYTLNMNGVDTNFTPDVRTYTINGLTSGQSYSFYVTASNSQGESLSLTPISITIANVPSVPTISHQFTGDLTSFLNEQLNIYDRYIITVTWPSPSNGSSPITAYNVFINTSSVPIVYDDTNTYDITQLT